MDLGVRFKGDRVELNALYGLSGAGDRVFGVESRVFFLVGKVRPYAHAAVGIGETNADNKMTYGFEGGGGVALAPGTSGYGRLEYWVEADVRYTAGGDPMVTGSTITATPRVVVPLMFGIDYPF
jgi:hypothetical protein